MGWSAPRKVPRQTLLLGLVHAKISAVELVAVEPLSSGVGNRCVGKFDECESPWTASFAIRWQGHAYQLADLPEETLQLAPCRVEVQIADEQLCRNGVLLSRIAQLPSTQREQRRRPRWRFAHYPAGRNRARDRRADDLISKRGQSSWWALAIRTTTMIGALGTGQHLTGFDVPAGEPRRAPRSLWQSRGGSAPPCRARPRSAVAAAAAPAARGVAVSRGSTRSSASDPAGGSRSLVGDLDLPGLDELLDLRILEGVRRDLRGFRQAEVQGLAAGKRYAQRLRALVGDDLHRCGLAATRWAAQGAPGRPRGELLLALRAWRLRLAVALLLRLRRRRAARLGWVLLLLIALLRPG